MTDTKADRRALIAAGVAKMRVRAEGPPAEPLPSPRLDSHERHLVDTIARLEAVVAERERQISTLQQSRAELAEKHHTILSDHERARDASQAELEQLDQVLADLSAAVATADVEYAALCEAGRLQLAAELAALSRLQDLEVKAADARTQRETVRAAGLAAADAVANAERATCADLQPLDDQVDRLRHGRYAEAQRRLPELRERLVARQAEAAARTAARAAEDARLEAECEAIRQRERAEASAADEAAGSTPAVAQAAPQTAAAAPVDAVAADPPQVVQGAEGGKRP